MERILQSECLNLNYSCSQDYLEYTSFFYDLGIENVSHYKSIISQYQAIIRNVSQEFGLQSVDLWEVTENQQEYYIDDEIHLNALGAQTVAEQIHTEIGSKISIIPPDSSEPLHFPYLIILLAMVFLIAYTGG